MAAYVREGPGRGLEWAAAADRGKAASRKRVIDLHQGRRSWGINPSPFCLKVEPFCQLAAVPYKSVATLPLKSPRGKLPFIIDDGQRITSTGNILAHSRAKASTKIDEGLDSL